MKPIYYCRPDFCPNCNRERSLELYDQFNKPFNLSLIIDKKLYIQFDNKKIYYFKCKHCGKMFSINWNNKNIPYPLIDYTKDKFLKYYKSLGNLINKRV